MLEQHDMEDSREELIKKVESGVYKLKFMRNENGRRSEVWTIFSAIEREDGSSVPNCLCCRVCRRIVKYNGKQTSNLNRHKCFIQKAIENRKAYEGNTIPVTVKTTTIANTSTSVANPKDDNLLVELKQSPDHTQFASVSPPPLHKWTMFDKVDVEPPNTNRNAAVAARTVPSTRNEMDASDSNASDSMPIYNVIETTNMNNLYGHGQRARARSLRTKKRKRDSSESNHNDLKREEQLRLRLHRDRASRNDADYNFLISFLPHMKNMTELGNLNFRMEMSKVLVKVKQQEMTTQSNPLLIEANETGSGSYFSDAD